MSGINVAGSVDIDASSRNTIGKSITPKYQEADLMEVVHIYDNNWVRWNSKSRGITYHIRFDADVVGDSFSKQLRLTLQSIAPSFLLTVFPPQSF